jgi:hypothetical protein
MPSPAPFPLTSHPDLLEARRGRCEKHNSGTVFTSEHPRHDTAMLVPLFALADNVKFYCKKTRRTHPKTLYWGHDDP